MKVYIQDRVAKIHGSDHPMHTSSSVVFHVFDGIYNFVDQFHRYPWNYTFSFGKSALECTKGYTRFLRRDTGKELKTDVNEKVSRR
jgi:hypothetical protein